MYDSNRNIEDLLADENFIIWARHPNKDRDAYWKSWLEAHPERKADVLLAKEIIARLQFTHTLPSQEAYDEVLHRLLKSGEKPANLPKKEITYQARKVNYGLKLAASFLLLALATALLARIWNEPPAPPKKTVAPTWSTKQNPTGLKSQIQLPDGTMVWLNAESTLKYPNQFDSAGREVFLVGEAFFDVARDETKPFTVHAGGLTTTALGTSFSVTSYPKEENISVALLTGKVIVREEEGKELNSMVLAPGEQAIYTESKHEFFRTIFDYDISLGWKDGLLAFKEADFAHIKRKLERWYGVQIEIKGVPRKSWKISGTFKNQSLERVLERLAFSKEFTFRISDDYVLINFFNQKPS